MVAILTAVTAETAVALGNLRRRGFAVTAIVNIFEDHEYAEAAGKLLAERIDTRHLKDETSVSEICRMHALPGEPSKYSSIRWRLSSESN